MTKKEERIYYMFELFCWMCFYISTYTNPELGSIKMNTLNGMWLLPVCILSFRTGYCIVKILDKY